MKKTALLWMYMATLTLAAQTPAGKPQHFPLPAEGWMMRQAHTTDWLLTRIPASVHTTLLKNNRIEDPFFRDNEQRVQWIENEDWEFQTHFDVPENIFQRKHIELIFNGLDTYASIFLNDTLIAETHNQFRTWRVDVKKWLRPTGNQLHIYFESALKKTAAEWENLGYELPGGQRVMCRKAQFHFGWDWGPRMVGCGILQVPELVGWDNFLLEDVHIVPQEIGQEQASLAIRIRYRSDMEEEADFVAKFAKRKTIEPRRLQRGVHQDSMTIDIPQPQLWYCRGMGEPFLYDITFEVQVGRGTVVEQQKLRFGIRKIELVTEKDRHGESFYFKLNGRRVFARGANYIPMSIFQDQVALKDYERLLDDVCQANMNMLRVWGGGIYETDDFYRLCDERGILVWQDFMFACAMYPGSGSFLKNVSREALEQLERLRRHPCLALFCGNNENNEAWHHWGWQMHFNEDQRTRLWRDYEILFNHLLPSLVESDGAGIPYWESSPKYGRAHARSLTEGDAHYWGVWHDEEPFSTFHKKVPRFMSEFGFQSFPAWGTIESFTAPEDRQLQSKVMLAHQKHPRGNTLIEKYMLRDYRKPKDFRQFVYVSQLLQAEGMRIGIEAHRRHKPYCMGTLYWQLNDVWQVASWSSIDNFGRWKALHYFVRDAFAPTIALPVVENEVFKIYAVHDGMHVVRSAQLSLHLYDFRGALLQTHQTERFSIHPDSAKLVWQMPLKNYLKKWKPDEVVAEVVLHIAEQDSVVYRRWFYFLPPRDLQLSAPKITVEKVEKVAAGYAITLKTNLLSKNVYLECDAEGFFQDNFFDLMPHQTATVVFKTTALLAQPDKAFRVQSLTDSY